MGKQDTMNSCDMKLLICAQGKHLTQFNYKLEVTLLCRGRRFSTYSFSSTTHIGGGGGRGGYGKKRRNAASTAEAFEHQHRSKQEQFSLGNTSNINF